MSNLFKKIYVGTLAKFNNADKDVNSLYLVQDETTKVRSIYKGDVKVAGDFIIVNGAVPDDPEQGVIYYISEFGKTDGRGGKPYVGFYNGTQWVALSDQATIEALDERIKEVEGAIKIDGTATAGSIGEKVATLIADDSIDGSVAKQVADAKKAIEGTLNDDDAKTIGEINDELDDIDASFKSINEELEAIKTKTSVKNGDKILSQNENGISSSISIKYAKEDKKIYLYGSAEDDTHKIGEIDTTDFVKDGMLSSAELNEGNDDHSVDKGPYIILTWNTDAGKDPMWISVKGLIDVYTGAENEIIVENNIISLADTIKAEIKNALNSISVSSVKTDTYVSLDVTAKADKAQEIGVQVTYGSFAADDATLVDGIATVSAVENEILAKVTKNKVDAEGDTYVNATASDNKVTVSATDSTKASLALADTAIQSVSAAVDGQEVTVSTTDKAVTVGVTKATYVGTENPDDKVLSTTGLVDAAVLKAYIADEIAKNAVYWQEL